jgi:hypothetical protein
MNTITGLPGGQQDHVQQRNMAATFSKSSSIRRYLKEKVPTQVLSSNCLLISFIFFSRRSISPNKYSNLKHGDQSFLISTWRKTCIVSVLGFLSNEVIRECFTNLLIRGKEHAQLSKFDRSILKLKHCGKHFFHCEVHRLGGQETDVPLSHAMICNHADYRGTTQEYRPLHCPHTIHRPHPLPTINGVHTK